MAVTWNLFQICVTSMVTIDKFFCQMCAHKYDLYNNNFFCHTCYTNTPIWSQQTQQEKLKICHIMSHMSHKYISMVTTNTVSCHTMSSHIILRYHWYCPQLEGSDRDWWALRLPSIAGVPINSKSSHQFLEFPSISGVPINSGHISWCMDHVIHSMWCPENFQQQSLLFTTGLLEEGLASWKHL